MCDKYVTCNECFEHREQYSDKLKQQEVTLASLQTETQMVKNIMYSILGTLVAGFAGTIFAILTI